ncbi:hypothetical protein DINM_003629 [Dirofilaria immitis]|nr:hypothetical protein [Dirofilaria immitis]
MTPWIEMINPAYRRTCGDKVTQGVTHEHLIAALLYSWEGLRLGPDPIWVIVSSSRGRRKTSWCRTRNFLGTSHPEVQDGLLSVSRREKLDTFVVVVRSLNHGAGTGCAECDCYAHAYTLCELNSDYSLATPDFSLSFFKMVS